MVALALLVGSVVVVSAQTPRDEGRGCGGPGVAGSAGAYDYKANPTFKAVADRLGVSTADLAKELQAGKSVADVAGAKKVSLDELVKIVDAPRKEMMGLMAKYGYAPQEQIDSRNEWMESWQKQALEQKGYFGAMGPRMMGGMMGSQGGFGGMVGGRSGFGGGMMGGFRAN